MRIDCSVYEGKNQARGKKISTKSVQKKPVEQKCAE
jgi:hypothetical protein